MGKIRKYLPCVVAVIALLGINGCYAIIAGSPAMFWGLTLGEAAILGIIWAAITFMEHTFDE